MVNRLNDLSRAEMAEILLEAEMRRLNRATQIDCPVCAKAFRPNRLWQKFCSKKCQQRWHVEYTEARFLSYEARIRALEHDKAELLRELAELRQKYSHSAAENR